MPRDRRRKFKFAGRTVFHLSRPVLTAPFGIFLSFMMVEWEYQWICDTGSFLYFFLHELYYHTNKGFYLSQKQEKKIQSILVIVMSGQPGRDSNQCPPLTSVEVSPGNTLTLNRVLDWLANTFNDFSPPLQPCTLNDNVSGFKVFSRTPKESDIMQRSGCGPAKEH